ncbi:MAG: hypothetical protein KME60_07135 [Cyanomargarita calcarea GSE-NOS-MK-12-04C]|uniref:Uncharacterized protein n=1 Tax=Cyanomargarita calcarea GSE-NOS-MK-12-04C TaxID=2839659 RepID=A0A951QLJ3_9CYAN|nr:hypothetical protein [Cyanomargarita calcarea GSE-NOS-MK-12-04C]
MAQRHHRIANKHTKLLLIDHRLMQRRGSCRGADIQTKIKGWKRCTQLEIALLGTML